MQLALQQLQQSTREHSRLQMRFQSVFDRIENQERDMEHPLSQDSVDTIEALIQAEQTFAKQFALMDDLITFGQASMINNITKGTFAGDVEEISDLLKGMNDVFQKLAAPRIVPPPAVKSRELWALLSKCEEVQRSYNDAYRKFEATVRSAYEWWPTRDEATIEMSRNQHRRGLGQNARDIIAELSD